MSRIWKRIIPFILALALGMSAASFLQNINSTGQAKLNTSDKGGYSNEGSGISSRHMDTGTGSAACGGKPKNGDCLETICLTCKDGKKCLPFAEDKAPEPVSSSSNKPLEIISRPRAQYTVEARENGTQGTVRLRVTFLASGNIGSASPITSLPDGLTEQAVVAAKQLKFKPATDNGRPINVSKIIEYSFELY